MADRKITDLNTLTSPVAGDLLPIVDISEAANVDKNKSITFGAMFRSLPDGTQGAPSIGWLSDNGVTGIYRYAENEIGFAANSSYVAKITSAGFQLGTGTPAAQLHLFSNDTTDQVIIENNDAGLDTAPDLVLYRNSASPAANDNLGNIEFRGKDAGGNDHAYAQIVAGIQTTTDASEDGILDLMSSAAGTTASRIRLYGPYVGIGESAPAYPLHLTTSLTSTALELECTADDSASGADITLYHHRNDTAGVADDIISTVFYRAKNDNATPADIDYAAIEGDVSDPTDTAEVGRLKFQVQTAGTLTTQLEIDGDTIGFFGTTAAGQPSAIADITTTATTGTLPTADGTVTIADAASPTNAELLEYCVELEAKLESALAALRTLGLIAT
jgi:hypothetical protein